jgi:hypothetical protein
VADQNSSLSQKRKAQAVAKFIFDLTTPAASRYWAAILRGLAALPVIVDAGELVMHLWHDPLSSKDLLEACVVFGMGLTFVIGFRWKK